MRCEDDAHANNCTNAITPRTKAQPSASGVKRRMEKRERLRALSSRVVGALVRERGGPRCGGSADDDGGCGRRAEQFTLSRSGWEGSMPIVKCGGAYAGAVAATRPADDAHWFGRAPGLRTGGSVGGGGGGGQFSAAAA